MMIRGVPVTVARKLASGTDRFGNATYATSTETVDDVLVSPGATDGLEASRPEGVEVAYTLHFPKAYQAPLEGCEIALPAPWGGSYRVVGDPGPYIDANTPTRWNRPVEVEASHG